MTFERQGGGRAGRGGPGRKWLRRACKAGLIGGMHAALAGRAAAADVQLPPISVGAGLQSSFDHASYGGTKSGSLDQFNLDSIRLYLNGSVTKEIKLTFNTEYKYLAASSNTSGSSSSTIQVIDAIARFEYSDQINIWAGRFLPPTDRANLYGPYYANDWFPFADGVADFYPTVTTGRDNGVMYWGQFGIVKVSAGVFDGSTTTGTPGTPAGTGNRRIIEAGRVMVDLWDPEAGYYLNGTYYGDKDVLAFGLAAQHQSDDSQDGGARGGSAWSFDGLMEKKLGGDAGVVSLEGEYQHDSGLVASSNGWYTLAAYLFPQAIGPGKFQVLGKYSEKTYHGALDDTKAKTKELNLNYIIDGFKARTGLFYLDSSDPTSSRHLTGLKVQLQL